MPAPPETSQQAPPITDKLPAEVYKLFEVRCQQLRLRLYNKIPVYGYCPLLSWQLQTWSDTHCEIARFRSPLAKAHMGQYTGQSATPMASCMP